MTSDIRLSIGCLALFALPSLTVAQPAKTDAKAAEAKIAERAAARLNPGSTFAVLVLTPEKAGRVGSAKVERPEAPLTRSDTEPPEVPSLPMKVVRPRTSVEPPLLTAWFGMPVGPSPLVLPDGPLAKQPGVNAQATPPLPLIGQYARDRVSLLDPSGEASMTLILVPQNPQRGELSPFMPFNVPDPFEHAVAVRLREAWPENREPPRFVTPQTRP